MAFQTPLFTKTSRLEEAIKIINNIDDSKFPLLLSRILQKIHLKDEESFTQEEENKLQSSLNIQEDKLGLLLETLSFILEQAAYHLCKPAILSSQLESIGMDLSKAVIMEQSWANSAKSVTEKLRQRVIVPVQLNDVNWELRLKLSQATMGKLKQPVGILQLDLTSEVATFEFNHDELYNFYNQLEVIQSQLDSLR